MDGSYAIAGIVLLVGIVGWIISQVNAGKTERPQLGTGSSSGPPPICKTCGSYGYWLVPYSVVACSRCNNSTAQTPVNPYAPSVPAPMQQPLAPPPLAVGPPVPAAVVPLPGNEIVGVQMPGAPFCPTCSAPTVWVANASAFGCQRCQKMV